ncbi:RICIN domain-containing protein [Saccharothrix saharensis]|uniref:RICIN domain-containing protein n=1 Tax=Saccharothrix saharensis TaxID=571190 RepID=UPI0036787BE5
MAVEKWFKASVVAVAAVLGAATVFATPALAATEYRSIRMQMSDWCIDVPNGSTADRVRLRTATCNGSLSQSWTFTADSSGTRGELHDKATNKCMDIRSSSTSYGGTVQQYRCDSPPRPVPVGLRHGVRHGPDPRPLTAAPGRSLSGGQRARPRGKAVVRDTRRSLA